MNVTKDTFQEYTSSQGKWKIGVYVSVRNVRKYEGVSNSTCEVHSICGSEVAFGRAAESTQAAPPSIEVDYATLWSPSISGIHQN